MQVDLILARDLDGVSDGDSLLSSVANQDRLSALVTTDLAHRARAVSRPIYVVFRRALQPLLYSVGQLCVSLLSTCPDPSGSSGGPTAAQGRADFRHPDLARV